MAGDFKDDDALAQAIIGELQFAMGYNEGELSRMRTEALKRYYDEPQPQVPGRANQNSTDIADTIEAMVAQILPSFAIDQVCEFEPDGDDDIAQVKLENLVVNDVVMERNHGYVLLQEALRDALLLRNGWIKAYLDETKKVKRETFEEIPLIALMSMVEQMSQQPGIEVEVSGLDPEEGDPEALVNVTLKVTATKQKFRVKAVDPVNMRWQRDYSSMFFDEPDFRFLAERIYPTQSWLIKQGYDKAAVKAAPTFQGILPSDLRARYRDTAEGTGYPIIAGSQRIIEAFWVFYMYDSDGDGVSELHRILFIENNDPSDRILENEIVSFVPYATGTPFLQPHQLNGMSIFDKLVGVENTKREVANNWTDNLKGANNSRLAINTRTVNAGDAMASRPGGLVRVSGPPGESLLPIPVVDVGSSALLALEYQDKTRSEKTGASLDMISKAEMNMAATASGTERVMGSREQMAAMVTRTLAETLVRQLWELTHRGMREWMEVPVKARTSDGQFVDVNPAEWPERERLNVKSGLSISERMAKKQTLEQVIAQQEKLAAAGYDGVLVSAGNYHAAILDWTRAALIDNGERYFLDPESQESQQAAEQKGQQAEQQQNEAKAIAEQQASALQQSEAIKSAIDKYKADQDTAFNYWKENLQAEVDMLKAETTSLTAIQMQASGAVRGNDAQQSSEADS